MVVGDQIAVFGDDHAAAGSGLHVLLQEAAVGDFFRLNFHDARLIQRCDLLDAHLAAGRNRLDFHLAGGRTVQRCGGAVHLVGQQAAAETDASGQQSAAEKAGDHRALHRLALLCQFFQHRIGFGLDTDSLAAGLFLSFCLGIRACMFL